MYCSLAPVQISSLEESSADIFALNCSSSGSPPTNVTWIKDGETIAMNETFTSTQYLRDGVTATYDSVLMIPLQPSQVIGAYMCIIDNSLSTPAQQSLSLQGQ